MQAFKYVLFFFIVSFIFCKDKEIREVDPEMKETKSVINIKEFLQCARNIKDFPETSNYLKILEQKKGYQKQLDYLKRIMPHNSEMTLCRKAARKTVPKYLDVEQFAI